VEKVKSAENWQDLAINREKLQEICLIERS